jgi:penicillin-binding protein 2
VGVTPRRNPDFVVAVLFEGGEHGALAARVAAQVVRAYVEKQRKRDVKYAEKFRPGTPENEAAVSAQPAMTPVASPVTNTPVAPKKAALWRDNTVEMGGVWSSMEAEEGRPNGGKFRIRVAPRAAALPVR